MEQKLTREEYISLLEITSGGLMTHPISRAYQVKQFTREYLAKRERVPPPETSAVVVVAADLLDIQNRVGIIDDEPS